ncbi:protein capicua homolog [Maniola jurtina]|uniref:protein capicua homolog n=1 Tax=Maniola jurtina TaxID=191418 RepID=UPI001E68994A|nr:protein capicua homolog [Maniola jurtina]
MSNNLENDRSITTGKMYPIDLAPQKITIVKTMSNTEVKMAHLIPGQPKTTSTSQIISHGGTGSMGLMRTAAQIMSPGVATQPQNMIVSGSPILQGTQIVSQGSQLIGQNSQIISPSQLISSGQLLSPGTQIISQGTQLSAQVSTASNTVPSSITNTSGNGPQLLNVGGLVSGAGNLVVSSSVRTLPPSVRVLPPMPQNTRPVLSNMNVNSSGGVLVSKGVTSHVPRGLAAGASLAVRPVTNSQAAPNTGAWSNNSRGGRGGRALVYGCRARSPAPRAPPPAPLAPQPAQSPHSTLATLPTTSVLTSSSVISTGARGPVPRAPTPTAPAPVTARPLPLLQRNYQPTKVVGVASVGVRGVGNSAPPQLYYEVPRPSPLQQQQQPATVQQPYQQQPVPHQLPRPLTPYGLANTLPTQVSVVNTVSTPEVRQPPTCIQNSLLPRPSILRKRDVEGSPTKTTALTNAVNAVNTIIGANITNIANIGINNQHTLNIGAYRPENTGWEDVPSGPGGAGSGSTTISAPSSPAPDIDPDPPTPEQDLSPRKKPRKQTLINDVRQCDYPTEDSVTSPPPVAVAPLAKRPSLSSTYVCGWRSTALHFTRPADVRRREPRARDIVAIASQKHVLTSAEGWKVHHLTAQMDDLVSLEGDVGEQLVGVLRALETAAARAHSPLHALQHTLLELIKGNIQRSKIVCEGIQEAREDILRVFTHRNFVSDILTRQADKRCFRKHRSQS